MFEITYFQSYRDQMDNNKKVKTKPITASICYPSMIKHTFIIISFYKRVLIHAP